MLNEDSNVHVIQRAGVRTATGRPHTRQRLKSTNQTTTSQTNSKAHRQVVQIAVQKSVQIAVQQAVRQHPPSIMRLRYASNGSSSAVTSPWAVAPSPVLSFLNSPACDNSSSSSSSSGTF